MRMWKSGFAGNSELGFGYTRIFLDWDDHNHQSGRAYCVTVAIEQFFFFTIRSESLL